MEKIQRLFNTIQEEINEKWEKNYVEFDCRMVEITEQVDNNSGHINDNCKDLKEQTTEELVNKVRISEVKKFDEVVRILEIHYQCGKDGVRNDGNEYYNHYNNYEQEEIIIIILRDLIKGINFIIITKIEVVDHVKET
ncbi:hypothetical protein FQA39_LY08251 [Lamprigera yunnana]|nr:hypothetical protein FQA39_LY08251 [Lamprigera yunnana]